MYRHAPVFGCFSALQRAEIAEICRSHYAVKHRNSFSALQRAEIAEMKDYVAPAEPVAEFQCSSTSRNC